MELRPYQIECVDAVMKAKARGRKRVLYVLPTGCGKTQVFCTLAEQILQQDRRPVLVIAHREELLSQAAARVKSMVPGLRVGIERAGQTCPPVAHVVVASVQTIGRKTSNRLQWLADRAPSAIIIDECFPAGSMVDGTPIEAIKTGDFVRSFNHNTNAIEIRRVAGTMKRPCSSLVRMRLSNGQEIVCTPNHPVWSRDKNGTWEYRAAGIINGSSVMVSITLRGENTNGLPVSNQRVLHVRCDSGIEIGARPTEDILLLGRVPRQEASAGQSANGSTLLCLQNSCSCGRAKASGTGPARAGVLLGQMPNQPCGKGSVGDNGGDQQETCLGTDEAEQPNEGCGDARQGFNVASCDGMETAHSGRERRVYSSANVDCGGARMGDGSYCEDRQTQGQGLADLLQNRCGERSVEDSNRSRRRFSLLADPTSGRPGEGRDFEIVGVDSVEIQEPGSDGTFGGLCPDGHVYNFEVEGNHNYFVSGVLVHNCHHATASGYQNVIERFGGYDGRAYVIGCTATPKRLDRKALHGIHGATFEEEVYRYEIRKAIKDGYLCPVRGYRVVSDVDMSKVGNVAGDFNQGQLAAAVNVDARTKKAVAHWKEVAGDRKTIAFCVNVEHAQAAAEAFRLVGARAECIHGALKPDDRKGILERLKSGQTQVVSNCEVLTEGFDQPDVSSVVMLRPTQSWGMYVQMVGRGTRLAPGKADLIVIDVVDNCQRHSLATVPAIIDLPPGLDLQGHSLEEAADALDELGAKAAMLQKSEPKDFAELRTMLRTVDLFGQVDPPAEVIQSSDLNWLSVPGGYYISAGEKRSGRITQDTLGNYHLQLFAEGEDHEPVLLGEDAGPSLRNADNLLLSTWPNSMNIVRRAARWRKEPPTEKQVETLMKFRVSPAAIAAMTKGQASSLIGQMIEQRNGGRQQSAVR